MPCDDITEVLTLAVDNDDKLRTYTLSKRTCGAEIGQNNLLQEWLCGTPCQSIVDLDGNSVRARYPDMLESDEFLYFKHLVALQESIKVLTGMAPGDVAQPHTCAVVSVMAEPDGVIFTGHIAIDAMTEKIKACGNCGSCGSAKKKRQALATQAPGA